jgi:hypothetical protein
MRDKRCLTTAWVAEKIPNFFLYFVCIFDELEKCYAFYGRNLVYYDSRDFNLPTVKKKKKIIL